MGNLSHLLFKTHSMADIGIPAACLTFILKSAGVFRGFNARGQTRLQTGNGVLVDNTFRGSPVKVFAGKFKIGIGQLDIAFSGSSANTAAVTAKGTFNG